MMPGRTPRKAAPPAARGGTGSEEKESEVVSECALQLRRIGDKWNLRQKILNLLTKLFCPET
ncbi:phorbol-12-myristate-13-acetate-induced protein 1 [Strigops habroptila]|uniref:phorbol-12-myristate-13-acetate-induced protein 1 n=1 Tax=Strigops habroptila TaxID=2489341 RepID=UPI0011CF7A7A|nr:phorbol-12-myristate-13-acetate-induced protein 1 [Strigops habroptila]